MAIICAVGENLRTDPTLFGRAVTAGADPAASGLAGGLRRNVTFVLRDADVPHATMRLHETFLMTAMKLPRRPRQNGALVGSLAPH
jgi:hypothetical protein